MGKTILGTWLFLVLILQHGYGQNIEVNTKRGKSKGKIERQIAEEQIKNLKKGILLIRLSTKSQTLETIREKGYDQKANEMEADQIALNKAIATTFPVNIKFCKTAFFYSEETDKLISKDFDNMKFMNGQLNEIPNPLVNDVYYLVLDLAILKERDPRYDTYRQVVTEKGIENKPVYYSSSNLRLPAFVVKDQNLEQLTDPFPYYVRAYSLEPEIDRILLAARKLNKSLFKFYKKATR
ncbi:hypothetical protein G3O08_12160 [Cryomorpha ignava]|uniref:Uncharacterized protein n=1 Tax=Cryomorpha ignava TaxID=101383 RepID=A0A7K3WRF6_9FLAO|nr:hypothetical protein [Cryomorpha ignava]NEN24257.1 hypothetical protein [Cryomorpha ignava]